MKDIRPFSFPLIWGLFFCLVHGNAFAQGQGTVVDSQTRQILVGANVRIEGTNTGTTTDAQGAFSLAVETNQRIAISHTGYLTRIVSGEFLQKERVIAMTPIAVQLEDVVVTARRSAQHLEKVPQKIDVISRTDLDRTVADDLTDALKKQTAIDIIQYPGLLSGVGIRGFRPQFSGLNQRSLLLIDGRHAGASNLATIDLNNIERIEVMKGPGSALYGAQAMGGVVNIISRKSTYLPRIDLAASYGSFGTFGASLSAGGPIGNGFDFDLGINLSDQNKDYRIGKGNVFQGMVGSDEAVVTYADGTTATKTERGDGEIRPNTKFSKNQGRLRLGYQIDEIWRLDSSVSRFIARNVETPGDIFYGAERAGRKNAENLSGDVQFAGLVGNHALQFKTYASEEVSESYNLRGIPFISFTRRNTWYGAQIQDAFALGSHLLTLGADWSSSNTEGKSWSAADTPRAPFSPNYGIHTQALFIEGSFNFLNEHLTTTAGGRLDRITFDGKQTPLLTSFNPGEETFTTFNPSAGFKYRIESSGLHVHSTIGRAFVTPDAFNVAGFSETGTGTGNVAITEGNADLDPENSITLDLGAGLTRPDMGLDIDITFFRTRVNDRITRQTTNPVGQVTASGDTIASRTTFVNANRSNMHGIEWKVSYDLGARRNYAYTFRFFANATHTLKAEDVTVTPATGAEMRRDIHNVANTSLSWGAEYDDGHFFNTRLTGRYVGNRKDTDWTDAKRPEVQYPAFMVADLVSSFKIGERYTVSLYLNNLTDENYYEKRGYNLPGRSARMQYAVRF